jgi:hypothetical protein
MRISIWGRFLNSFAPCRPLNDERKKRLKPTEIRVGDFVYCRSKYYRDQLQLPEELGLVIEVKRSNFKVLYTNDKRCWLPRETINRSRPELTYTNFLEKLFYLIKKVHALECELVSDQGTHRLSLRIDKIDHDTVDDLRRFLGPGFISLTVVPEGMAFMQLELVFTA